MLSYCQENKKDLQFPWKGLTLIIAKDDAASEEVDYVEKYIRVDCSDISAQWMAAFSRITQLKLLKMEEISEKIQLMEKETVERLTLLFLYQQQTTRHTVGIREEYLDRVPRFVLELSKGHTCNEKKFAYFLSRMEQQLPTTPPFQASETQSIPIDSIGRKATDTAATVEDNTADQHEIDSRLMKIKIIIEDSYGTKLLEDGSFRLDYTISAQEIVDLWNGENLWNCFEKTLKHLQAEDEVHSMEQNIQQTLRCLSIHKGLGIDDDKYFSALRNLNLYLLRKNRIKSFPADKGSLNKGMLKHLHGLNIVIGHFHGIRDDGACMIPWNFPIHEYS
jgi:hypothetical protein